MLTKSQILRTLKLREKTAHHNYTKKQKSQIEKLLKEKLEKAPLGSYCITVTYDGLINDTVKRSLKKRGFYFKEFLSNPEDLRTEISTLPVSQN